LQSFWASELDLGSFNAEGTEEIHDDRKKETAYRTVKWRWQEWHGRDTVERSKFIDVPYKRYPRTFIEPPAIELTIRQAGSGDKIVTVPGITYTGSVTEPLLHSVNLLLELFGECDLFGTHLVGTLPASVRRLNWTVLPAGQHPWRQLKTQSNRYSTRLAKEHEWL
jgi:hypothetical protein